MDDLEVSSSNTGVDRLGEVLDKIAQLTLEANDIKADLKAQAELIGDRVAFTGGTYVATVVTRPTKKVDWHGIVFELKVPQKKVDAYTTTSILQVCSVKRQG
jgi:hypothetical protein